MAIFQKYEEQVSPLIQRTLHRLPRGIRTHSFTISSLLGECSSFSAAEAIHTVSISVPSDTHYYGAHGHRGVDSKLAMGSFPNDQR